MKVISLKICPFVQRVVALLEAKGLSYEVEYIGMKDRPQWFLDLSPTGQVPVLVTDDGHTLFESDAIAEYLEEAFAPLEPGVSPVKRAEYRAWSYMATKNYLVQCSTQRSPSEADLQERGRRLQEAFDRVESRLSGSTYFSGEGIGMVDVAWLPLLHRADIVRRRTGYDFVGDRPKLRSWQQSMLDTTLATRSVSPDFEDVFSAFYLSNETFLGAGHDVATQEVGRTSSSTNRCG